MENVAGSAFGDTITGDAVGNYLDGVDGADIVFGGEGGVVGTIVLIAGVIAIPYPGPGWLIVFAGLGILATEFEWAGRVLRFARRYYDRWTAWVKRQNKVVQLLLALATCAIVLVTLWLLDAPWIVAKFVGLGHWTWLRSPIMA